MAYPSVGKGIDPLPQDMKERMKSHALLLEKEGTLSELFEKNAISEDLYRQIRRLDKMRNILVHQYV